jgi:membrane protease YdiL (CAAX protease family)
MKNIIIFIAGVMLIAWGANFWASTLDSTNPAMTSVGVSVGAMGPLFMAIVLRKFAKQGWHNAGLSMKLKQNRGWYTFSLFYTPLVIILLTTISLMIGAAQMAPDRMAAVNSMLTTFGIVLVPMLFLSVGEEFGWRGYLEPGLWSINKRIVLNHVFVGVIWGFWHFPILLFNPSSNTNVVQLLMVLLGCVALAIIYGQMRLWSDSIWPCVILHAVSNAVMISVASSKLLLFNDGVSDIISFNTTSVAMTGIWVITSLLVLAMQRNRSAAQLV